MQNNIYLLPALAFVKRCNRFVLDLQWFAEGATASGAQSGTASASADAMTTQATANTAQIANETHKQNTPSGEQLSRAARRQARAAGEKVATENPLAHVKYGKQEAPSVDAAQQGEMQEHATEKGAESAAKASSVGQEDKTATFEKMIRGDYKEEFSARMQAIINQRFKQTKQLEAKSQRADALMENLARRYGVNASDVDAIVNAAATDESYTKQQAQSRGISVEEMRRVKALESENAQLRSRETTRATQDAAQRLCQTWLRDGEQLKSIYPSFDFQREAKNGEFAKLLKSGVPLRKAYEAMHLDELLGGAMQYTADQVTKGMVARMSDRASRPSENGTTPRAGAVLKADVAGLTRADREEIERRVMRGERILF